MGYLNKAAVVLSVDQFLKVLVRLKLISVATNRSIEPSDLEDLTKRHWYD